VDWSDINGCSVDVARHFERASDLQSSIRRHESVSVATQIHMIP